MLALLPLIGQVLPHLLPALATPLSASIVDKAGEIAKRVFGTTDPEQIKLEIQRDQSKLEMFKAQLDAATKEEMAYLADIQSARQLTVALVKEGSPIAWGAPLVSVLLTIGFFAILAIFLVWATELPEFQRSVLYVLIGTLASGFTQVVNYWLGSSRGSKEKDAALTSLAAASTATASTVAKTIAGNGHTQPTRMFR
jgi:hypothetical protein